MCVPEGALVGQRAPSDGVATRSDPKDLRQSVEGRRTIIRVGRKSGKTAFAACLLLVYLADPAAIPNSQLFSTAQPRDPSPAAQERRDDDASAHGYLLPDIDEGREFLFVLAAHDRPRT